MKGSNSGSKGIGSFQAMGLEKDLLKGLNRMGYNAPTPVQRKALPIVLAGVDTVCMARTGSGKTCVFLLPMIQKLKAHDPTSGVRAVILSPTRELAVQSFKFAKGMAKFTDLRIVSIIGGDAIEGQFESLATHPDIIVATPGRLMHQLKEVSTFKLKHVQYLVFDEADRLFEMGFSEQLYEIIKECPAERQTLLFSATMPKQLAGFARAGLRDPQFISLETDTKLSEELRTAHFYVRSNEKVAAFMYLVRRIIPPNQLTIVFTATKHHSEFLHAMLKKMGYSSAIVYGSMDQDARSDNLRLFRNAQVNFLIVTDVAARGIDIPLLNNVINFHFTPAAKLFIHRCGRAARQGRIGFALSLVEPDEMAYLMDVHALLGQELITPGTDSEVTKPLEGLLGGSEAMKRKSHEDDDDVSDLDDDDLDDEAQSSTPVTSTAGRKLRFPIEPYTLATMTPSMTHTGLLPQDVIDEENEYLKSVLADSDALAMLYRISENAMQQYRRTRSEATKPGVKAAKALTKEGAIKELHPLIVGMDPDRCSQQVIAKQNFVRLLQTFRPAQTVFETGIGTGTAATAIKAKSKAGSKESKGVEIMKAMRVTTAAVLERNKPLRAAYFAQVAEQQKRLKESENNAPEEADDVHDEVDGNSDNDHDEFIMDDEYDGVEDDDDDNEPCFTKKSNRKGKGMTSASAAAQDDDNASVVTTATVSQKRRLSAAEKRKLKKGGGSVQVQANEEDDYLNVDEDGDDSRAHKKRSYTPGGPMGQFRDERFFMSYGDEDEHAKFSDDVLQPQSGLRNSEARGAAMMEHAMLDILPEDAMEINKKRRMLRWDAKKRKFVKQTLEEMASSKTSSAKRIRSESGGITSSSSKPQGEMYEAWKKKTKREVTLPGVGLDLAEDSNRPRPNVKYNANVKSELRSAGEIRKMKAARDDNKLKNMSKDARRKLQGKKKQSKGKYVPDKIKYNTSGPNRKMKVIIR